MCRTLSCVNGRGQGAAGVCGLVPLHGASVFATKVTLRAGVGHLTGVGAHMPRYVGTETRGVRAVRAFVGVLYTSIHAVEGHLQPPGTLWTLLWCRVYGLIDHVCIVQVCVHLRLSAPTARYPRRPARPLQRAQSNFRIKLSPADFSVSSPGMQTASHHPLTTTLAPAHPLPAEGDGILRLILLPIIQTRLLFS